VAAVNTVEIADRQCAGGPAFGIGKTAEDSHDSGWDGAKRRPSAAKLEIINVQGPRTAFPPGSPLSQ
jgi:hypothetical protein